MDRRDAEAVVTLMDAAWPAAQLLDDDGQLTMRGELFAGDLATVDPEDAVNAIEVLRRTETWHGGPTSAVFLETLEEARRSRLRRAVPALPHGATPEVGPADEKFVAEVLGEYWGRNGDSLTTAARIHGPNRVEQIRARLRKRLELGEPAPSASRPPERTETEFTSCGAAWGTPAVQDADGVWRCPNCDSPIRNGCLPRREAEASA